MKVETTRKTDLETVIELSIDELAHLAGGGEVTQTGLDFGMLRVRKMKEDNHGARTGNRISYRTKSEEQNSQPSRDHSRH